MSASQLMHNHFQVCYVVLDLDTAKIKLSQSFGITHWYDLPHSTMARKIAMAYVGALMIELIEPHPDVASIYSGFVPADRDGLRLHHLGFLAPDDAAFDDIVASFRDRGIKIAVEGEVPGKVRYMYADTVAELGHWYELILLLPAGQDWFTPVPQNLQHSPDA